jgi:WhiB family transcriptional regulator, redox-sensing transcriptional regulator
MDEIEQMGQATSSQAVLRLPGAWVEQALCTRVDPEWFFPKAGSSPHRAKKVCARCPVRLECLAWALTHNEEFGVWGGTSEQERRRMRGRHRRPEPVRDRTRRHAG